MDPVLERIARLAAHSLGAPVALVVVPDSTADAEPGMTARLEAPLVSPTGHDHGKLQVLDWPPRQWSDADEAVLREFAALAAAALEARLEREEQRRSDERVHQVQRMEATSRMVGRIAHDFNNLLTTIKGNTDLVLLELERDSPVRPDLEEVKHAAERGASFTRQLLAFARSQLLQPEPLQLATLVAGAVPAVQQRLGPGIAVTTRFAPEGGVVNADAGQLEQVLLRLADNAREAMADGGGFVLEVRNAVLTEKDRSRNPYVKPGAYVLLEVRDTGCGMEPDVAARAFEPFFTTRSRKGAGLGLSMVYGVVKQTGGHVWIDSAPGRGTRVSMYLPRLADPLPVDAEPTHTHTAAAAPQGKGETILLVDDETSVRNLGERILQRSGYVVLQAADSGQALRVAAGHPGRIDLLVADLVMPHMGGRELARRFYRLRPETRVLFTSGFTAEAALQPQVLQVGEAFISKPFGPDQLACKVREVLDAEHTSAK